MVNRRQIDRLVEKIARVEKIIKNFQVVEEVEVEFGIYEPTTTTYAPPVEGSYAPIQKGSRWGKPFGYAWFGANIKEPKQFKGKKVLLECRTGAFESLVFISGKPYGLFDHIDGNEGRLHRYIPLDFTDGAVRVDVESYASHRYNGTQPYETQVTFGKESLVSEDRVYEGFKLVVLDDSVTRFIDNMYLLNSLYRSLAENDFFKAELVDCYMRIYSKIDLMPSEILDTRVLDIVSCDIENVITDKEYRKSKGDKHYQAGLVGHSHLDTAWLWPVEETKRKAARTASTAVRLLKEIDGYKFVMSSVLYLDWFKKLYPSLFDDIKELTKQGKFEPNGAVWVECDCNLTGNEALVRQFVYGQLFLRKELGYEADCFWLPDTFGYSAALPQIMSKANVKYFYTTKLSWNDTNQFPYDTFIWEGLDGSKVTAHFNCIHCFADPQKITERVNSLQNKLATNKTLISYGYGDGGGGPEQKMVEYAIKSQSIRGIPKAKHVTISQFMQDIKTDKLPTYSGELYLELHRGTLTSVHSLKQLNRRFEKAMHDLELVCAAMNRHDKKAEIDELYKVLLLNQFHDILPGTSMNEVNELAIKENLEGIAKARMLTDSLLMAKRNEKCLSALNTLGFKREGFVSISGAYSFNGTPNYTYVDLDGNQETSVYLRANAFETVKLQISDSKQDRKKTSFKRGAKILKTPKLTVKFDENMFITSLYDIESDRELCQGKLNALTLYRDVPHSWDNWDIDADYILKGQLCKLLSSSTVVDNEYEYRIRSIYRVGESSELTQDMVFYADSLSVDFKTKIDWKETHYLLKTLFETSIFTRTMKSETQFGYIERSVKKNTSQQQAMFEVSNHKWTDISENAYGATLINDCKYGISGDGGTLGLSLLKSGTHPDSSADHGIKYFNYKFQPHAGGFNFDNVIKGAYIYNYQPVVTIGETTMPITATCDMGGVIIETVKPSEDGSAIVLRVYESEGNNTAATLSFDNEYKIEECNLLEDCVTVCGKADLYRLKFKPFEIKTIKLRI